MLSKFPQKFSSNSSKFIQFTHVKFLLSSQTLVNSVNASDPRPSLQLAWFIDPPGLILWLTGLGCTSPVLGSIIVNSLAFIQSDPG